MMLWTFRSAVQSRQTSDITLGVGRTAGSTKVRTPEGGDLNDLNVETLLSKKNKELNELNNMRTVG